MNCTLVQCDGQNEDWIEYFNLFKSSQNVSLQEDCSFTSTYTSLSGLHCYIMYMSCKGVS